MRDQVFKGTRWEENWNGTLKRLVGAEPQQRIRIGGVPAWALKIPLTSLETE